MKVSFTETNDIKPVYQIERVESDTIIIELPGLDTADIPLSGGDPLYQELVRVSGFDSPSDVSAFEGPDLGEGVHPWWLQVRELYVVDKEKTSDEKMTDGTVSLIIHLFTMLLRSSDGSI